MTKMTNEKIIWNYLIGKGLSPAGAAGLMGNLYAESALSPTNLQNSFEKPLGVTDAEYTAAVDNGSYKNFAKDKAGYGLAQWTYHTRKAALLAHCRAVGASVGDLNAQLDFLVKELSERYSGVLSALKTATSVRAASDLVLTKFERPRNMDEKVKTKRTGYGQKYFDRYAKAEAEEIGGSEATRSKESSWKIGDTVTFTGTVHYSSSDAKRGLPCKSGKATITGIYPRGKHPYHLIRKPGQGATVYGWVDADCITKP